MGTLILENSDSPSLRFEAFRSALYSGMAKEEPENKQELKRILDREWARVESDIARIGDEIRLQYQKIFLRFDQEECSDHIAAAAHRELIQYGRALFRNVQGGDFTDLLRLENILSSHPGRLIGQEKLTLEALGIERKDYDKARKACYVREGVKLVEEIRAGNLSRVVSLNLLLMTANSQSEPDQRIAFEDVGIREDIFLKWELDEMIESRRKIIETAQAGDYSRLSEIFMGALESRRDYGTLKISKQDFQKLEHDRDVAMARRYREKAQAGDYDSLFLLQRLLQPIDASAPKVEYGEVDFDEAGFRDWIQQQYRLIGLRWVEECEGGDYAHLDTLELALQYGRMRFSELALTEDKLSRWINRRDAEEARDIVREIQRGNYDHVMELEMFLDGGTVSLKDLKEAKPDIQASDLQKWRKERDLIDGKVYAKELKSGERIVLGVLEALLDEGNITLKDLHIKRSEYRKWARRL